MKETFRAIKEEGNLFEVTLVVVGATLVLGFFLIGAKIAGVTVPNAGWEKYILLLLGIIILSTGVVTYFRKNKKIDGVSVAVSDPKAATDGVPEGGKDIEIYWGFRPFAVSQIIDSLRKAQGRIFICGMGLNSLDDVLNEPGVIDRIAKQMLADAHFNVTILFVNQPDSYPFIGKERTDIEGRISSGKKVLTRFIVNLTSQVPMALLREHIELVEYAGGTFPRHFILQTNEGADGGVIYCGSYLSHLQGKHSYLLKLRDRSGATGGLYALFKEEARFLRSKANHVQIDVLLTG